MRRALIIFVLALVVGGAVGTLMTRDPGYVLLTYGGMSFETSLWFAIVALVLLYVVLRLIARVMAALLRGGAGIQSWQQNRRSRNARERTVRGLLFASEGDWSGARKALVAVAPHADMPLVNYLVAARAANELGDVSARDALLQKARESTPESALAVACEQAEMQIAAQQHADAVATLLTAKDAGAGQARVLQLLVRCYEHERAWPELLLLAPELERRRASSPEELRVGLRRWWLGFFSDGGATDEITKRLAQQWQSAGKDLRGDPELILAEVDALLKSGDAAVAETNLRKAIGDDWRDELVARYGTLRSPQVDRQLGAAEGWLKGHPNDPVLLVTLGRLALMNEEQSKARDYFEASLKLHAGAEVCAELGRLYVAGGDVARGAELLLQAVDPGAVMPESSAPAVTAAARS